MNINPNQNKWKNSYCRDSSAKILKHVKEPILTILLSDKKTSSIPLKSQSAAKPPRIRSQHHSHIQDKLSP